MTQQHLAPQRRLEAPQRALLQQAKTRNQVALNAAAEPVPRVLAEAMVVPEADRPIFSKF